MNMFETADFYLACYLRCVGLELFKVRRERGRCIFVFKDQPDRQEKIVNFYNNEAAVSPLGFTGIIRDMKAMIHNV